MTKAQKQSINIRITIFKIFLTMFIALIILRLFIVSINQHGYYTALAENQHNFFQKLMPNRGEIFISDKFSAKPYAVATNSTRYLVYAVPSLIKNPVDTSQALADILAGQDSTKMDQKEIMSKISDTKKQYVPLMHELSDQQYNQIIKANIEGIRTDPENVRYYPEGDFLSQALGFVGYKNNSDQKVGLYGLERYFEKDLAGNAGQISTEADFKGNWITGSKRDFVPAKDGASLLLTVDRSIQYEAQKVLSSAVQTHGADSGTVIVENPKTGAILAMASYPSFDPNQYNKAKDPSLYLNAATTENYEPGSTFKAVTMAAGLDLGLVTPDTTFNDSGEVDVDNYKIQNSDHKAHGQVSMTQVIDHSLNTGAIFVQQRVGNDKFLDYVKRFGMGQATNVELPETGGDIANLKTNRQVNFYTAAFGQGITTTPMQMLQAYSSIANGGQMMQPYIIDSKLMSDGTVKKTVPVARGQVISQKTAALLTGMLVDDVENGYGKKAAVKGYYIAGKTGTAQVVAKGKYLANDNIGSFVGYGPVDNPQFAMIVNINHPRDVLFAESTAAPAFGQIAQFILNYYQIAPRR